MPRFKITSYWNHKNGDSCLVLNKSCGKFTLDQIEEYLRYKNSGNFQGNWAIILRCGQQTCGGSGWSALKFAVEPSANFKTRLLAMRPGWFDDMDENGDVVSLFQLGEGEKCPVCNEFMPLEYCPHCGEPVNEPPKN